MKPSTSEHTGTIDHFHEAFRDRPPQHGLGAIEGEMPSVERWNRQKIENAYADRQQRDQLDQPFEAELGGASRHVGNPDRSAELTTVFTPDDKALQKLTGPFDHMAGFADGFDQSSGRRVGDNARFPSSRLLTTPMAATLTLLPSASSCSMSSGVALNVTSRPSRNTTKTIGLRPPLNESLQIGERLDEIAVDGYESVAGQEAGGRRGLPDAPPATIGSDDRP